MVAIRDHSTSGPVVNGAIFTGDAVAD